MEKVNLISWIDKKDIKASLNSFIDDKGPVLNTLLHKDFVNVYLLDGYPSDIDDCETYRDALEDYLEHQQAKPEISILKLNQKNDATFPINFDLIFNSVYDTIYRLQKHSPFDLDVLLAPGSSVMHAAWPLVITKLKQSLPSLEVSLISSSIEDGVYQIESGEGSFVNISEEISRRKAFNKSPIDSGFEEIIGDSNVLSSIIEKAKRVSQFSNESVLIEGESGTGKELFSNAIHNSSVRSKTGKMISVNCGAFSDELFRAELFGYLKGSFTGAEKDQDGLIAAAEGGTLFLDEIADLSLNNQKLLLRFLTDGMVARIGETSARNINVRIIAASNKNLLSQIEKHLFREDLYYRLSTFTITLPSLKERIDDINLLSEFYVNQINKEYLEYPDFVSKELSDEALIKLKEYNWPGNIRELIICLKNCIVFSDNKVITAEDIRSNLNRDYIVSEENKPLKVELALPTNTDNENLINLLEEGFSIKKLTTEIQNHYLQIALSHTGGNKKRAAELLGIHPQNMNDWIDKLS